MNKRRYRNRCFLIAQKSLTLVLLLLCMCSNLGSIAHITFLPTVKEVEAAVRTIDGSVEAAGTSHLLAGPQTVFISDQVGYKFYRDASGECAYSKTTNGGNAWGAAVLVDDQGTGTDCIAIAVWYDQWTPGDTTGSYIHVATMDTGTDDVYYNRVDTANSDTRLLGPTAVPASTNSLQNLTNVAGENYPSITKGTDGTVYISQDDTTDSYVVECSASCNLAESWVETGIRPQDLANDYSVLVPLPGGDIMLINRDISANDIRTKIWNNTAWSAAWTIIDANATGNTTYDVGMSATVDSSGDVYLAYTAGNTTLGIDDQVRTARYSSGTWTVMTPALSGTALGVTGTAIARDATTGRVFVAYSGRTTAATAQTGNVYWKVSADNMSSWSTQTGPVNELADDIYGVDLNNLSNQRIYVTWNGGDADAIYGDTIADLVPGVIVSTEGSQTATLNTPVSNTHIGGSFVFTEYVSSRDVTSVTLSENGTIDGSTAIENIKLYYENDTTFPYNCASETYDGTETQFGSEDVNGFSAADGVSNFSGSSAQVSKTSSLCFYVVLDINNSAADGETLNIVIEDPSADVSVTNGGEVGFSTQADISGSTVILNDAPVQSHFHWRNDDGSETTATSRTFGFEDTNLTALQQNTPVRLRIGVSNEGGVGTLPISYRLEYSVTLSTCEMASDWTDVGAASDAFDMYPTANVTEGDNTTNIAVGNGGVSDENSVFLATNGGMRDLSSQTGSIVLETTEHVDLEYSIVATASAAEGNTYCFRVTDAGTPLSSYTVLPQAIIAADVSVATLGSQVATTTVPQTDFYIGGTYVISENTDSRNVTSITVTENGTIDASVELAEIRLFYELDTTAPYDCSSESYDGTESVFGSSDADGFSGANGTSTFTGSVTVSTVSSLCVYPVVDVLSTAKNGNTINITIANPATDVEVSSGGTVSPTITRDITGETILEGAILTQTHYHWRNDDGSETDATSLTLGTQDIPLSNIAQNMQVRLRMEVSNQGTVSSPATSLRLEYGTKITSCENVSSWTDVGTASGAWDMFDSPHISEGADTTDIAENIGGVTSENSTFITENGAIRDTASQIGAVTFTNDEFLEAEFSIRQTTYAAFDTTYCFRLSDAGTPLNAYVAYPEISTSPERDFEIQRGTVLVSGTGVTLTAGVDYIAPASLNNAFVRITNSHHTGAGDDSLGGTQNADDVSAYISNPQNLLTSFTITRPAAAVSNTYVSWEIIEFIGTAGSDNEIIVRDHNTVTYGTTATSVTGPTVSGVADDADVVVFITGQFSPDTAATNYNSMQSTSAWSAGTDAPVFTRGVAGNDAVRVSYAVVEFVGVNWKVQRAEHTYTLAGSTETENIVAVNSLNRTFLHSQKRIANALTGVDEFGHEVWLSSIGAVSFFLEANATTPSGQTSVAWVIENTQTSNGAMQVTRSNGNSTGGTEPLAVSVSIGATLEDITNSSIFASTRGAGTGTAHPRAIAGFAIASTTHYQLWRSDTGSAVTYRVEVLQWPTAGLSFRQNDYRFYVDNEQLDPTDPWPSGVVDIGENTVITGADEPLGDGERIRIRMSLTVLNSTFPEESKNFKLQYGERISTCGAIPEQNWIDTGSIGSGAIWRGYDAIGVSDGTVLAGKIPVDGELNLAVSDTAGTLEEQNVSSLNPYSVEEGDDIEYDWIVQQNGASAETFYCFRMIESNDTALGAYADYPTLRTSSFTPLAQNWQWYADAENETPVTALAAENTAPIDISFNDVMKLRVTVNEVENIARENVRFKLQYSEYADFASVYDVVATSSCTASSTWCYYNGGGNDNQVISTGLLSDSESCVDGIGDGCGTHNEGPELLPGFRHNNGAATEYEFSLITNAPRANAVYYFRMYDVTQDVPVALNTAKTHPSVVIEGASLVFNVSGLSTGTVISGVTLDVDSTPTSIPFGTIPFDTDYEAAYRLNVSTNATEGYHVLMYTDQELLNEYGQAIPDVLGTNASPTGWSPHGCATSATGCFGYHTTDGTLQSGFRERFAGDDTYSGFSTTTPQEVMYSSLPANDTHDIVYRLKVTEEQSAGHYQTTVTYLAIPVY